LCIILEQSQELNSSLYINFLDYEKSVWQRRQRVLMEVIKTLRSARKDYMHHQKLLWGIDVQCGAREPNDWRLSSEDRSETGLFVVTILVSANHWLGHEDIHNTETEWHTVDKDRWPRLCRRPSPPLA
jgi:hypothetical protein